MHEIKLTFVGDTSATDPPIDASDTIFPFLKIISPLPGMRYVVSGQKSALLVGEQAT